LIRNHHSVKYFRSSFVYIDKELFMNKYSRLLPFPLGTLCMAAMIAVFGTITMVLWNVLLPSLFGFPVLSWLQATGLLILCRVLFGGITGGLGSIVGDARRRAGTNLFRGRWDAMSEEQRQHLSEEIKKRHGFDPRGAFDCGRSPWSRGDTGTQENADNKKDEVD
jgi:hypothetical protein